MCRRRTESIIPRFWRTPQIEAVLVASATDTHVEISQAAAKPGKHIFCEKPISLDLEQIDETLAIVEKAGVKFQVGFNRRFDASFMPVYVRRSPLGRLASRTSCGSRAEIQHRHRLNTSRSLVEFFLT